MSQKILYILDNYFNELTKLSDNGKLPKVIMFSGNKGQGQIHSNTSFISLHF